MGFKENVQMFKVIAREIFKSKIANTDITKVSIRTNTGVFPGRTFGNGKLRGFDIEFNPGKKVIPLRIIEQNPDKADKYQNLSTYAILARQGKQIVWIIRKDTNEFIGRLVDDGKGDFDFTKSEPRALTSVKYDHGGYTTQPVVGEDQFGQEYHEYDTGFVSNLPEINLGEEAIYITGL